MANTVLRYSPQTQMVPTRSLIDQLLEGSFFAPASTDRRYTPGSSFPANLVETNGGYAVQVGLPGLNADKLEINVAQRELHIKGMYETKKLDEGHYIWNGLPSGEFSQAFTLPGEVVGDGAEATYTDGILTVQLPKAQHARVKNIPVKKTV